MFSKILTELEYSGIGRNKEQSARLLRHMIANAPKLVKPYQEPILKVIYVTYALCMYALFNIGAICQYSATWLYTYVCRYLRFKL